MTKISDSISGRRISNPVQKYVPWLYSLWKFSRPHTIVGTSLSVLGLYLITLDLNTQIDSQNWWNYKLINNSIIPLGITWLSCLFGNIYIVGLNQLEDIEIDQINKPDLPLASGEYSKRQAQIIIAVTGILALILAAIQGKFLLGTVGISLLIGTAYSLPPIRLKRFPFWAAFCILTVRGVIVNLGLFLNFDWILSGRSLDYGLRLPAEVIMLTLFVLAFTIAIAIFKDIPDLEGDRQYNISTLTIRLGARAVFNLSRLILTICYLGMIGLGLVFSYTIPLKWLIITHGFALALMFWRSANVDLNDRVSITAFYQFIWKLFFLEYLMFPIICFL
ncbi:MAG: homogentisate phytyltransferase [Oscillatoriales cyanobacterium RM2_1_1]|nr:homogentisate phytyltransferase [Oscillatoriales cyanobacterium SM2_3_0]NJO44708.1 homogentisate phytyltransferase [Oscillatoriales cyanobacterium RM2_1_1]